MNCGVIRAFPSDAQDPQSAERLIRSEIEQYGKQITAIHACYSEAARNVRNPTMDRTVSVIVTDDIDKFTIAPRGLQVGSGVVAIPVVARVGQSSGMDMYLLDTDTLTFSNAGGTEVLVIAVSKLFAGEIRPVKFASSSSRHSTMITISGSQNETPAPETMIKNLACVPENYPLPQSVCGWIYITTSMVVERAFEIHNPICAPHIPVVISRSRDSAKSAVSIVTEASRTELQSIKERIINTNLANISFFYECDPNIPAITPLVAAHIDSCMNGNLVSALRPKDMDVFIVPLTTSRGSENGKDLLTYAGVTYVGFRNERFYDIIRGNGCGDLSIGSSTRGKEMDPLAQTEGQLYFMVAMHQIRVLQNMLQTAVDTATGLRMKVEDAVDACAEFFKGKDGWKVAETKAAVKFGTVANVRALYFWGFYNRSKGVRFISNLEKRHAIGLQFEDPDSWENEGVEEAQYQAEKESEKTVGYASSIQEVLDEILSSIGRSEAKCSLVDRRYPYDELMPEQMTSMTVCRSLSEVVSVRYKVRGDLNHVAAIQKTVVDKIDALVRVKTSVEYVTTSKTGVTKTTLVDYPHYTSRKDDPDILNNAHNISFTISFAPGSYDAARICALLHIYVTNDVFVYVAFKGKEPPSRWDNALKKKVYTSTTPGIPTLYDLKYIFGKDPRVTPSWTGEYYQATEMAFASREDATKGINAAGPRNGKKIVIYKHAGGAYRDPRRLERVVADFIRTEDPSKLVNQEEIEYALSHVNSTMSGDRLRSFQLILAEHKLENILGEMRAAFPELRRLFIEKSIGTGTKDLEMHKKYGLLSRAYREYMMKAIVIAKKTSYTQNDLRKKFIEIQDKVLLNMIDDSFTRQINATQSRAIEQRTAGTGSTTVSLFMTRLWGNKQAEEEEEVAGESADLATIRAEEDRVRYDNIIEISKSPDPNVMVTAADRFWAIGYEKQKGFVGAKFFAEEIRRNKLMSTMVTNNTEAVTNALSVNLAYAKDTFIGRDVAKTIQTLYANIQDYNLADDLLRRISHWVSSAKYKHADFPMGHELWKSHDPMAFHVWSVQNKVVTSATLGSVEWDRERCGIVFLDTIIAMINEHSAAKTLTLVNADGTDGRFRDEDDEEYVMPMRSLLRDNYSRNRLKDMENDVPTLTDAEYEEILRRAVTQGLDASLRTSIAFLFKKRIMLPSAKMMKSITAKFTREANDEVDKANVDFEATKLDYETKTANLAKIKILVADAKAKLAVAEAEHKTNAFQVSLGQSQPTILEASAKATRECNNNLRALMLKETAIDHEISAAGVEHRFAARKHAEVIEKYCDADGNISTNSREFTKMLLGHFPNGPSEINMTEFISTIMRQYKNFLDRAIYVAMRRTGHYVADPVVIKPILQGIDGSISSNASDSADREISDIASSELIHGSQASDHNTLTIANKCPDDTTTTTVDFRSEALILEVKANTVVRVPNLSVFLWDFI